MVEFDANPNYNCVDVWEKKKDKWKLKLLDKKKKVE